MGDEQLVLVNPDRKSTIHQRRVTNRGMPSSDFERQNHEDDPEVAGGGAHPPSTANAQVAAAADEGAQEVILTERALLNPIQQQQLQEGQEIVEEVNQV